MNIDSIRADYSKYIEPYSSIRTFHEEIGAILRIRKWNAAIFKECTGLTDMAYTRLTKQPDYKFSKRVIVTICIGLELDIGTTERLLALQGYYLSMSLQETADLAYRFLIERRINDIETCNQVLSELGVEKTQHLGTLSKK